MEQFSNTQPTPDSRKKPERIQTSTEKLRGYLLAEQIKLGKDFAERQVGTPEGEQLKVASDFRLIPPPDLYGQEEKDLEKKGLEIVFGTSDKEKLKSAEDNSSGTRFEMLKTAIMHKHMGKRFIVVRSSRYDDSANGVDNIIVDKKNGETICAFDEVNTSFKEKEILEKANWVISKNIGSDIKASFRQDSLPQEVGEQGVRLKYGIQITPEGKMKCSEMKHLPIFLLGVDEDHLYEGLRTFVNGEGKSRYETELFKFFLKTLSAQIQMLKLKPTQYKTLPEELTRRVESFDSYIDEALKELK